jgi:hypothetical protein
MVTIENRKLYVVKKNTESFFEGEIVESSRIRRYKTKTWVTDHKVIGKWPCCGCNMIKSELITNKNLEYLGEL